MYLSIFVLLYVGVHLIIESYRRDPDQWLHRPLPIGENGKRICCSAHYGGDEYIYHGEVFHGARLDAFCGGIRMDLRGAVITEDEEIEIHTLLWRYRALCASGGERRSKEPQLYRWRKQFNRTAD